MECKDEQDETRRTSWASTASSSISSRLNLVLLLDSVGLGRVSAVDDAQLLLTLIKITAQVTCHPFPLHCSPKKSCDDGQAAKRQGTLAAVIRKLSQRRLMSYGRSPLTWSSSGIWQPPERLSSFFRSTLITSVV